MFTIAIIDMSHGLPDSAGTPEAAAAASWRDVADVVVLATAWSKQEFNGVLDYLELPELPSLLSSHKCPRARVVTENIP